MQAQREAKERERQLRELAMNEQDAAALKIQGVARKRNAKNRMKRKRDAKRREEEMKDDGKEWTQEEQDAAIGVERPYSHGGSRARTQSGGEGRLGIRRGFVQDVALSRGCREDAIIT